MRDFINLAYFDFPQKIIGEHLNITRQTVGTYAKNLNLIKQEKVIIGQKFGKLSVLEKLLEPNTQREIRWKCECECGNFTVCSTNTLVSKHSESCGCNRLQVIKTGYKNISGTWYGNIKRMAKKRNIDFFVSKEYLQELLYNQNFKCNLSGLPISISTKRSGKIYYKETTASLDRVDNNLPYVEGNVQFLHKHINYMKWIHDQKYFIELCRKVADNETITKYNTKS